MLMTPLDKHWKNMQEGTNMNLLAADKEKFSSPEFGIILVSQIGIHFVKENPSLWKQLSKMTETELLRM